MQRRPVVLLPLLVLGERPAYWSPPLGHWLLAGCHSGVGRYQSVDNRIAEVTLVFGIIDGLGPLGWADGPWTFYSERGDLNSFFQRRSFEVLCPQELGIRLEFDRAGGTLVEASQPQVSTSVRETRGARQVPAFRTLCIRFAEALRITQPAHRGMRQVGHMVDSFANPLAAKMIQTGIDVPPHLFPIVPHQIILLQNRRQVAQPAHQ